MYDVHQTLLLSCFIRGWALRICGFPISIGRSLVSSLATCACFPFASLFPSLFCLQIYPFLPPFIFFCSLCLALFPLLADLLGSFFTVPSAELTLLLWVTDWASVCWEPLRNRAAWLLPPATASSRHLLPLPELLGSAELFLSLLFFKIWAFLKN